MSPRLPKEVLASSQAHLCLPCRLRHVPPCKCFNPRYQHAEASQHGKNTPGTSLASLQQNHRDSSKDSAENAAGPQATKLQQLLQRQFAERRRLGLRQTTQTEAKKTEGSRESQATGLPQKEKVVKPCRIRRPLKPKSSVSVSSLQKAILRSAAIPTSKKSKETTSRIPRHQQVIATEKKSPPSTNPLLKLHADVQKLKKALNTSDKKKRASQIRLSTLKAAKVQAKNVARRVSSTPERSPPRLASNGIRVKNRSSGTALMKNVLVNREKSKRVLVNRVKSKSVLVNRVKSKRVLVNRVKSKGVVVNGAKSSRRETITSKKPEQTPVRMPPRTGSGQNAVIETINAKALKISGNISCVMALIQNLIITAVEVDQPPVPSLSFGLERVLFKSVSFPSLLSI